MVTDVTIRDVLTRDYVGVSESDTIEDTVDLLRESRSSSAVVLRGEEAVGIVTEWDFMELLLEGDPPTDAPVSRVMSSPVISASPDATLPEAAATMAAENIRNLLVTDAGETVGVLTQRDVIAAVGSVRGNEDPRSEILGSPGAAAADAGADDRTAVANGGSVFARQGICENCGALAESLWERNGRLLCEDCQRV